MAYHQNAFLDERLSWNKKGIVHYIHYTDELCHSNELSYGNQDYFCVQIVVDKLHICEVCG